MGRSCWSVWGSFWTRKGWGAFPRERAPPQAAGGKKVFIVLGEAEADEPPVVARDRHERAVYLYLKDVPLWEVEDASRKSRG